MKKPPTIREQLDQIHTVLVVIAFLLIIIILLLSLGCGITHQEGGERVERSEVTGEYMTAAASEPNGPAADSQMRMLVLNDFCGHWLGGTKIIRITGPCRRAFRMNPNPEYPCDSILQHNEPNRRTILYLKNNPWDLNGDGIVNLKDFFNK